MVNNPTKQYPSGVAKDIISIDLSILKSEIESDMITSKQLERKEKKEKAWRILYPSPICIFLYVYHVYPHLLVMTSLYKRQNQKYN